MGAAEEAYSLATIHRPVEKAIEGSGLAWTFLRPNSFMQNAVTFLAQTIRAEGAFYGASGQARISHVDVRDIAAEAVMALTARGHEGNIHTLSGPEALTYDDMADELSKALGRAIRHISLPSADLKAGMLAEGMPEAIADRMLDLERLAARGIAVAHRAGIICFGCARASMAAAPRGTSRRTRTRSRPCRSATASVAAAHAHVHLAHGHRPSRRSEHPAANQCGLGIRFEHERPRRLERTRDRHLAIHPSPGRQ